MRVLWLTRQYPRPVVSGDLLYGLNLITALGETGARTTVLCLDTAVRTSRDADGDVVEEGNVRWVRLPRRETSRALSAFSTLPAASHRLATPEYKRALAAYLYEPWDAVVANHISMGWVRHEILRARNAGRRLPLFFVTHNHEETVKAEVSQAFEGPWLIRLALRYDAWKNRVQERAMLAASGMASAITEYDRTLFQADLPGKPFVVLTPGYDGARLSSRTINAATPRRVVVLGALEWVGKQQNLRTFLAAAEPRFSAAGIEVEIVGLAPKAFRREIEGWASCARFTGRVDDFMPNLRNARLGVMPDTIGSGFKHKNLNYIFNGLPIASIASQVKDLPLSPGEDMITAETPEALAAVIAEVIDDLPRLNDLQARALAKCSTLFEWASTGRTLRASLERLAKSG